MYRTWDNRALWDSDTHEEDGQYAVMEENGNFAVYDSSGGRKWSSYSFSDLGGFLILQDDGNLVRHTTGNWDFLANYDFLQKI